MNRLLILFALGCALGVAVIGFGWAQRDDGLGWLGASLAAYLGAQLVGDRP